MIGHLEALLIIIGQLAVWTLVRQLKHEVDHQTTPTTQAPRSEARRSAMTFNYAAALLAKLSTPQRTRHSRQYPGDA
jgi:hypothetical protein